MKLRIFEYPQTDYRLALESDDPDRIKEIILDLEWEEITGAKLVFDELNWIELSGSKNDNFCIIYSDGEDAWITKDAPELEPAILALQAYAMKGNQWKELFEWEHYSKAGAKAAGCASVIILLFILTPILTFGTYHLLNS